MEPMHKDLLAFLPYALWWERGGDSGMVDMVVDVVRALDRGPRDMTWSVVRLLYETDPGLPTRVAIRLSPYAFWRSSHCANSVAQWAATALAVPYTEEVCQSVVDTLLQIASNHSLQSLIPVDIWAWLKKRPSLPPVCTGREEGTQGHVVRRVRGLGDIEILESYFIVVWSEWHPIYHSDGFSEMRASIREDFGGIGMWRHREVLIKHLDHVLGELDKGLEYLMQQNPRLIGGYIPGAREGYERLKEALLEADREALGILTSTLFRLTNLFGLLTPADIHRSPLGIHLRTPSPISVVTRPQRSLLVPPTRRALARHRERSFVLVVSLYIDSSMLSGRVE